VILFKAQTFIGPATFRRRFYFMIAGTYVVFHKKLNQAEMRNTSSYKRPLPFLHHYNMY